VLGIGQRGNAALSRFAHKQYSPRAEDHQARAIDLAGKNGDVEAVRRLELIQIERSIGGVGRRGQEGSCKNKEKDGKDGHEIGTSTHVLVDDFSSVADHTFSKLSADFLNETTKVVPCPRPVGTFYIESR
jgi:hypothetical protein